MQITKTSQRLVGGGQDIFICRHGRTATDKCIKDFEDQEGFTFIDAEPDGNCFFHTLAMYYGFKHTNHIIIHRNLHMELRQHVVKYMLARYQDYEPLGIAKEDIEEMGEDGMWNSDAGDLMPPAAATALQLHIKLYDIVPGTRTPYTKKRILLHHYPEEEGIPEDTVHVLRINKGQYGLLLPPVQPKVAKANTNALAASLTSLSVSSPSIKTTKTTKKTTSRRTKSKK